MNRGEAQNESPAFPILAGDIGGTHARFALLPAADAPTVRFPDALTADHATIEDALAATLARSDLAPRSAMLAVAGPIAGDEVALTNCDWSIAPPRLMERFDLGDVALLNDFEAQALALPGLGPDDLDQIGGGGTTPDGPRVVVGPGTGLGAGALVRSGDIWIPIPGEGGHVDLGPRTPRDLAIWPNIDPPHGRVEAETLVSGGGMLRLYRAVCATDGTAARHATPEAVTAAALAGDDAQAVETAVLFTTYLGRLAGDLALIFMAHGGVYLAGGIPQKIAAVLKAGAFREAFVAKAPHDDLLETIATAIVVKDDAALAGVSAFASAPGSFGVSLAGRRWRR